LKSAAAPRVEPPYDWLQLTITHLTEPHHTCFGGFQEILMLNKFYHFFFFQFGALFPNGDEYLISPPHYQYAVKVISYENKQSHQLWDVTLKGY